MAAMLRGGKQRDGAVIAVMPFDSLKNISGTDAATLYLDPKSLRPWPTSAD